MLQEVHADIGVAIKCRRRDSTGDCSPLIVGQNKEPVGGRHPHAAQGVFGPTLDSLFKAEAALNVRGCSLAHGSPFLSSSDCTKLTMRFSLSLL
uniref:Uncharacterized protein n=1 Tax=Thermogemmatispora argillosa TaxID=2045280 RepID=A0A455T5W9_9CHLR|nr:hypothetical protein KTA_35750 [Thermogemmatispora argillosa]